MGARGAQGRTRCEANDVGIEKFHKRDERVENSRACVAKFAYSRKHKTYLKMLLKHLLEGKLAQVYSKKLKVAVDTMLPDVQPSEPKKIRRILSYKVLI